MHRSINMISLFHYVEIEVIQTKAGWSFNDTGVWGRSGSSSSRLNMKQILYRYNICCYLHAPVCKYRLNTSNYYGREFARNENRQHHIRIIRRVKGVGGFWEREWLIAAAARSADIDRELPPRPSSCCMMLMQSKAKSTNDILRITRTIFPYNPTTSMTSWFTSAV